MGVVETLGLESLLSDVQRMDKRQVGLFKMIKQFRQHNLNINEMFILVFIPSSKFWYDRIFRINDMERFNGCYWK